MKISSTLYSALVLGGVLALSALAVALPHDPYVRWQTFKGTMFSRASLHYERLNFDPEPVDILFIGSSRTAAGINPPLLEKYLEGHGHPLRVLDMSLPASGMDIRVAQAREAFQAKPGIRLVVIAVVEALPRDGHQAFGDLASASDVLASPIVVNRNLPANIVRLPMRQMKLAAASVSPNAFGYQSEFNRLAYPGSSFDHSGGTSDDVEEAHYLTNAHREALESESARRKREITPPILPDSLAFVEFGVSRTSIERLRAIAEANGAEVAFMFLPFYHGYERPQDADWISQQGNLWIADWMRQEPSYYKDAAHGSVFVQERLNMWASDRILSELGLQSVATED